MSGDDKKEGITVNLDGLLSKVEDNEKSDEGCGPYFYENHTKDNTASHEVNLVDIFTRQPFRCTFLRLSIPNSNTSNIKYRFNKGDTDKTGVKNTVVTYYLLRVKRILITFIAANDYVEIEAW